MRRGLGGVTVVAFVILFCGMAAQLAPTLDLTREAIPVFMSIRAEGRL